MDCIWVNLKNVGPTFLKVYLSLYVIYTAGKSFSFVMRAVILQMKDSALPMTKLNKIT